MVWLILILFVVVLVLAFIGLGKVVVSTVLEREAVRLDEEEFGSFAYTDEEWAIVYQNQFVDDTRGRRFLDKHSSIISFTESASPPNERKIQFSNLSIYIFGDGKQKTFRLHLLNPAGNGVHLLSTRILHVEPMKRLDIKINVDVITEDSRTDFDVEYLIQIPRSADDRILDIDNNYGRVIMDA